jgi:hypothetical protein
MRLRPSLATRTGLRVVRWCLEEKEKIIGKISFSRSIFLFFSSISLVVLCFSLAVKKKNKGTHTSKGG